MQSEVVDSSTSVVPIETPALVVSGLETLAVESVSTAEVPAEKVSTVLAVLTSVSEAVVPEDEITTWVVSPEADSDSDADETSVRVRVIEDVSVRPVASVVTPSVVMEPWSVSLLEPSTWEDVPGISVLPSDVAGSSVESVVPE